MTAPRREVQHTLRCAFCPAFLMLTIGGAHELRSVGQALDNIAAAARWQLWRDGWVCPGCTQITPIRTGEINRADEVSDASLCGPCRMLRRF